jgi:predicted TIM-barrel fold metal-dependent hydrolase
MQREYHVIDADGHVLEPFAIWDTYMEPRFRARAPQLVVDTTGHERLHLDGNIIGSPRMLGLLGALGQHDAQPSESRRYTDGRAGGFDPHERIKDMDLDGIDAVFLYPSIGLFSGAITDPDLAWAMCRAYNRWLADYCMPYPDRLFPIAMLPMQSIEAALAEMRFTRKTLGMRGGFLRPNPYNNRMAGHPDYDPFWAEAQALDFCIGFHEGGASGMPTVGIERFDSRGARHIISHTMEMMLTAVSVIWGGVCERFPQIRISFLESGGGWIAAWLDRMDRHFDDPWLNDSRLNMRPSELFQRNCWIAFEPVEGNLTVLAEYIGPNKILWATDYPHADGFFPGAPALIAHRPSLTAATKHGILAGGAKAFYGLA